MAMTSSQRFSTWWWAHSTLISTTRFETTGPPRLSRSPAARVPMPSISAVNACGQRQLTLGRGRCSCSATYQPPEGDEGRVYIEPYPLETNKVVLNNCHFTEFPSGISCPSCCGACARPFIHFFCPSSCGTEQSWWKPCLATASGRQSLSCTIST
jgi:hypothetical protein